MLVTFSCPAHPDIIIFGDLAVRLLKLMGRSGTVPSALLAEDVKTALQRLESAMKDKRQLPESEESALCWGEGPELILPHQALPVIKLIKAARKTKCHVIWESDHGGNWDNPGHSPDQT